MKNHSSIRVKFSDFKIKKDPLDLFRAKPQKGLIKVRR
jgi:hypothetical protein